MSTQQANQKIQKLISKIQHDVAIDETRLSNELKEQGSKFAYWAAACAIKTQEYLAKKRETSEIEAKVSRNVEERLHKQKSMDPKTRITDKVIKDYVLLDPDYQDIQREMIDLGLESDILAGAKEAFRIRAQALLEMCRTERAEMTTPESVYHRLLMKSYEVEDEER